MRPIYSICICNYNMAETLEAALKSVLDQLDDRYEVIVIDDGSTDSSKEKLHKISKEYQNLIIYQFLNSVWRKKIDLCTSYLHLYIHLYLL